MACFDTLSMHMCKTGQKLGQICRIVFRKPRTRVISTELNLSLRQIRLTKGAAYSSKDFVKVRQRGHLICEPSGP
jgi:hypothetical protein